MCGIFHVHNTSVQLCLGCLVLEICFILEIFHVWDSLCLSYCMAETINVGVTSCLRYFKFGKPRVRDTSWLRYFMVGMRHVRDTSCWYYTSCLVLCF